MAEFRRRLELSVTLKALQTAIRNEESAGFLLKRFSITSDLLANQLVVEGGAPPEAEIEVQDLAASSVDEATAKAETLHESLPEDGGVVAFGEVSIEGELKWVAAFRQKGVGVEVAAQPAGQVPRLPDYAAGLLEPAQGVPWAKARAQAAADNYEGCFPGSLHLFENLVAMPNGVTTALFYESKFSIDNDGIGGNDAGDAHHQGHTTLRDALGKSLNADRDSFGVIPLDADEARAAHAADSRVALKMAGVPDFTAQFGLRIGDLGVAFWRQAATGQVRRTFFIYADKGPANKLGEGSVKMARELGINSDPNNGGFEAGEMKAMKKGAVHIGFPGSGENFMAGGNQSRLVPAQIETAAQACFDAFLRQPVTSAIPRAVLAGALSDEVDIPAVNLINRGLTPASEKTMLDKFGRPGRLTDDCSAPSPALAPLMVQDFDVGPFKVSGMRAAAELLKAALDEVKSLSPEVHKALRNDGLGMQCVRHRRHNQNGFSNHSWGTAIDLKFGDSEVDFGKPKTQRGFLALYPSFNKFGWFWGAEFSGDSVDSMHFELSEEAIAKIPKPA